MGTGKTPVVCIIMGSQSDWPVMQEAARMLEAMGVDPSLGSAMGVFDLTRGVATRKLAPADPAEVQRVSVAMRAALAADPIPTVNATVSSRVKL